MLTTIALDYGNVLAGPVSGDWMLPANFPQALGMANVLKFAAAAPKLPALLQQAKAYLDDNHLLHTEEEEYAQFREFYRILFGGAGIKKGLGGICDGLARHSVYEDNAHQLYDDVLPGIVALKEHHRVIVISDTWPSLRRRLRNNGVLALLDDLIMSCDYGRCKNHEGGLLTSAIERRGVVPGETLFVDDSADNLAAAKALGFHAALMDREGKAEDSEYKIVRGMEEVAALARGFTNARNTTQRII